MPDEKAPSSGAFLPLSLMYFLSGEPMHYLSGVDNRRIMNAIFYVLRTGMPWRDLPERYGPYTTAYNRFNRWSRRGIWKRIFDTLASKSRDGLYLIDSTIVKAHRAASGAKGGSKIRRSVSAAAVVPRKSMRLSTARAVR